MDDGALLYNSTRLCDTAPSPQSTAIPPCEVFHHAPASHRHRGNTAQAAQGGLGGQLAAPSVSLAGLAGRQAPWGRSERLRTCLPPGLGEGALSSLALLFYGLPSGSGSATSTPCAYVLICNTGIEDIPLPTLSPLRQWVAGPDATGQLWGPDADNSGRSTSSPSASQSRVLLCLLWDLEAL